MSPWETSHFPSRSLPLSWVIPGKLALGRLPGPGDAAILAHHGIGAVLTLCSEKEGILPEEITRSFHCGRLVLPDSHYRIVPDPQQIAKAVEVVHRCVQGQLPLYVHCLAGVERAPLICIAYLCRYRNLSLTDALLWLKQIHPRTNPTAEQLKVLEVFLAGC